MIGVIANPSDYAVVREFFELFKTPWEFYRGDRYYDVLLCAGEGELHDSDAGMIVIYASRRVSLDIDTHIKSSGSRACLLSWKGTSIPIYGKCVTFLEQRSGAGDSRTVVHRNNLRGRKVTRIGYDLFDEVRILLTVGQPAANAAIPALELHIDLLRDLIVSSGIPLVEIPPVPEGYRFIACLTHDVDHPSIRQHRFDRTMFGFLYRALAGSLLGVVRRQASWRNLYANWAAALKLPFVYLGLASDFWLEFVRYTSLEDGAPSSFFVIPFRNSPGSGRQGPAPAARASRYEAADISSEIHELMSAGCEIGLHGIDAWRDSARGLAELEQIRRITGVQEIGVRMHWLYFDERSAVELEKAGADYDSTIGYNETIGFRAGTAQAFKPLNAIWLLELPLHVMDTALFFPGYLNLSPDAARERVGEIIDATVRFGGSLTVNWHDRSIAPERLWSGVYAELLPELRQKGAWFATASQAVSWFRKRRSAVFENVRTESGELQVAVASNSSQELPALQIRVHNGPLHGNAVTGRALHGISQSIQ